MKDMLSFLIRQHTVASAASSVSEALDVWLPLVEKLAAVYEQSAAQQLTSMLLFSMYAEGNVIEKNGFHKEESAVDTDTEVKADESGTLDKLPDNCLSHCLSFLHFRDVLQNVELSCRRLFHVSRARKTQRSVPFGGMRLDTTEFRSKEEVLYFANFYKNGITAIHCSLRDYELLSLTFPNLKSVDFQMGEDFLCHFSEFLTRQPYLYECCFRRDLRQDPDFYRELATVTQLTEVSIDNYNDVDLDLVTLPPMVGLSHIRQLTLNCIDSWALFHPFVHSQLTRLWLHFEETVTTGPYFEIRLPNLEFIDLRMANCLHIVQATLNQFHAPKLKELEVHCGFDAAPQCLRLCPNGDVTLELWGKQEALQQVAVDKALAQLRADRHLFALKSLRLAVNEFRNYEFVIRFVVEMALMLEPVTAVVEIEAERTTEQLQICHQFKSVGAEGLLQSGDVRIIGIE